MSKYDHVLLYLAMLFAMLTFEVVAIWFYFGQPPRHCHYLVPVRSHPSIYACSEHPRPLAKP